MKTKGKMLIAVALVLAMLLNCFMPFMKVYADDETTPVVGGNVVITLNSALYKGIKANLRAQNISATYNDAQRILIISQDAINSVTKLELSNYGIKDLTGLDTFKNVVDLDLSSNELTQDSNLAVLNSLPLSKLDLSTNKIESVSDITILDSISELNLHNQKFNTVEVITLDATETSDGITQYRTVLPEILMQAGPLKAGWFDRDSISGSQNSINIAPEAIWSSLNPHSTEIVLDVGYRDTEGFYQVKYGMITLKIRITDSTNVLAGTEINQYYVIVDTEHTGVIFKDKNLYDAVKNQLTEDQELNSELDSYIDADNKKQLYTDSYDDALVLNIENDDLINRISSLILDNKQISDLTGLEQFVGVEKKLDLSYNKIDSIDRLVELKENKIAKEKELQSKVSSYISLIQDVAKKIVEQKKTLEEKTKQKEELEENNATLRAEVTELNQKIGEETDEAKITELQNQINEKNNKISEQTTKINELSNDIAALQSLVDYNTAILIERVKKLYSTYNRTYLLTGTITEELDMLPYENLTSLSHSEAVELLRDELNYLIKCDEDNAFNPIERKMIMDEYHITSSTEEHPIAEYFKNYIEIHLKDDESANLLSLSTIMNTFLNPLRRMNVYSRLSHFKELSRDRYSMEEFLDVNLDREYYLLSSDKRLIADNIKNGIYTEGLENSMWLYYYELKSEVANNNGYYLSTNIANYNSFGTDTYIILANQLNINSSSIPTYVILPILRLLNINANLIENIDEITIYEQLEELYAYHNELVDISNVDWSNLSKLQKLNLGYNSISNIKPLEVLAKLTELDVSKNLLSGEFDFNLIDLPELQKVDFSSNQYDDIEYLATQYQFIAKEAGYNNVGDYIIASEIARIAEKPKLDNGKKLAPEILFYNQTLFMNLVLTKEGDNTTVELPKIFSQIEEIDHTRTCFGIESLTGTVSNDGTRLILDTRNTGSYNGLVKIITENGRPDTNGYSMGDGTVCYVNYIVTNVQVTGVEITPGTAEVVKGNSQAFAATVNGTNITNETNSVTWTVEAPEGSENTIATDTRIDTNGILTVSENEPNTTLVVKATSNYDNTKSATATVTVKDASESNDPIVSSVTISPKTAEVVKGNSQAFTATAEGDNITKENVVFTWSVSGNQSESTTITNQGVLTIGEDESAETLTVTVNASTTSNNSGSTAIDTATVTVKDTSSEPNVPSVSSVVISPKTAEVSKGNSQTFTKTVQGTNLTDDNTTVVWSVEDNTSTNTKVVNGVLTVGSNETAETIKVTVSVSAGTTTASDTATVTITTASPVNPSDPTLDPTTLGYTVKGDYLVGIAPKTPVADFKTKLANGYNVVLVKENEDGTKETITSGYVKTGMLARIEDTNGNAVKDTNGDPLVFEVAVKGDINGDGLANSIDSAYIKAHRNEAITLNGVQFEAADINNDGKVDIKDSKLLLYHRAEVTGYNLNYTK